MLRKGRSQGRRRTERTRKPSHNSEKNPPRRSAATAARARWSFASPTSSESGNTRRPPSRRPISTIRPSYDLFIGGKWISPLSKKFFSTINPATEETLSTVAEAGAADVDAAVRAAERAYEKYWRRMPGKERGKYLYRIARMLQEKAREFAVLETMDGGKPIKESRDVDVPLAAAHFFYYAGWADKLDYALPGRKARPIGVCGQVIPWNFPLLMAAWKLAPALACGNTCRSSSPPRRRRSRRSTSRASSRRRTSRPAS